MEPLRSPIEVLEDAAGDSALTQLVANFGLPEGRDLLVEIRVERTSVASSARFSWTERGGREEAAGPAEGVRDALDKVLAAYPRAVLEVDSVRVSVRKASLRADRIRTLFIRAWHEVAGLPGPTRTQLRRKTRTDGSSPGKPIDPVDLLRARPAAIKEFNALPAAERDRLDLKGIDLARTQLDRVDFARANLTRAEFSSASLVRARFAEHPVDGGLLGARLPGADLTGAAFEGSCCAGSDFSGAILKGARLKNCDLKGALFVGADLSKTNLTGSNVCGADFTGANLSGLVFRKGEFNDSTRWPERVLPPPALTWKGAGPDPRQRPSKPSAAGTIPTTFEGLLKRLPNLVDSGRLSKALDMLKAERFQLYAKVHEDHLVGVVKSQSSPHLVYSCRLTHDGSYGCCTQNLNVCGGLRGSPCKHLLVLIVGLARAEALDPATALDWTRASRGRKSLLDKDAMSETLLQYKGAEAGEIDWRPTDTLPEDFYTM